MLNEPIAHLVWLQGRRAADDVEDYYEVARPGDKSVDGSDPFPVYASPSDAERHERSEPIGYKRPVDKDGTAFWCSHTQNCYYSQPVYAAPPPPAAVQEPVAVKGETPSPQTSLSGWQPMETAPKDGKHSILAIPAGGGFIYSIQGSFMRGKWMNAADINAEPLAWMPNILLPDEFCPWTDEFKSRAALSATATEGE